jgi:replicative DNA helicase
MTVLADDLAERQTLGCIARGATDTVDLLELEDFASPLHRRVFAAMQRLKARNEPIELPLVLTEIYRDPRCDAGVDPQTTRSVLDLGDHVVTHLSAMYYTAALLDARIRRRAQEAGERLIQAAETADVVTIAALLHRETEAVERQFDRRRAIR